MRTLLRFALPLMVGPTLASAVYAPIPEQEQGKALTFRLGASAYQDSNIFGGATGEISSMVYNFNGAISYNGSVDDQTFASASYELSNDHIVDRPGKKNLTSHTFNARLAHSFSPATNIDLSAAYNIAKNPLSLLNGVARAVIVEQCHPMWQLCAQHFRPMHVVEWNDRHRAPRFVPQQIAPLDLLTIEQLEQRVWSLRSGEHPNIRLAGDALHA